jgi:hypothetical protein
MQWTNRRSRAIRPDRMAADAAPGLPDRAYSRDSTPPQDYEPAQAIDYARATLTEIADHFKTDKGSIKHRYTETYERYLAPLRTRPGMRLLEIGVACGSSLKTWARYFADAQVIGVDVREPCRGLCQGYANISIRIGDATRSAQPGRFDVIIDDGSHISADIVDMFRINWPSVAPGGLYIIEDLKCTHSAQYPMRTAIRADPERFRREHFIGFLDEELRRMDWRQSDVAFMHFYTELVFIGKVSEAIDPSHISR